MVAEAATAQAGREHWRDISRRYRRPVQRRWMGSRGPPPYHDVMQPDAPPPEPRDSQRRGLRPTRPGGWPRWGIWAGVALLLGLFLVSPYFGSSNREKITYSQFIDRVRDDKVESVSIDNDSNAINGIDNDGERFKVSGPDQVPDEDLTVL